MADKFSQYVVSKIYVAKLVPGLYVLYYTLQGEFRLGYICLAS